MSARRFDVLTVKNKRRFQLFARLRDVSTVSACTRSRSVFTLFSPLRVMVFTRDPVVRMIPFFPSGPRTVAVRGLVETVDDCKGRPHPPRGSVARRTRGRGTLSRILRELVSIAPYARVHDPLFFLSPSLPFCSLFANSAPLRRPPSPRTLAKGSFAPARVRADDARARTA